MESDVKAVKLVTLQTVLDVLLDIMKTKLTLKLQDAQDVSPIVTNVLAPQSVQSVQLAMYLLLTDLPVELNVVIIVQLVIV